jgi:F-type H+-transporting ATPase subunit gamma
MSHRHAIEQHMRTLDEVSNIMAAMKNLALMEVRKLGRYHDNQSAMAQTLRRAAEDLLGHYPLPQQPAPARQVFLLFGAERGFCGAFNESLRLAFAAADGDARCIAVGRRLHNRMENEPRLLAAIDGASVAEEVTPVLEQVLRTIAEQQSRQSLALTALFHDSEAGPVQRMALLPPFSDLSPAAAQHSQPPLLNLPPAALLAELGEHYLFAALYRIAYASLLAENQQRVRHLEAAVHRLEDRLEELARRCRTLRQEEITEEIEVLLLNVASR